MNIKSKKLLVVFAVVLITTVIAPIRSNAGLQANKGGTSLVNTTASQFFDGMRKMETKYGTLGKEAVLNDKYLDTTNNGIDVHMVLNTEWGTIALLTDSAFGVGKGIAGSSNNSTSTGNESGVYNLANGKYENVASSFSGTSNTFDKVMRGSDSRYYNNYSSSIFKSGDAINCEQWLSAGKHEWSDYDYPIFTRGDNGLFGFGRGTGRDNIYYTTRAVVVCGENL